MEADFLFILTRTQNGSNPEDTYTLSTKSYRPILLKQTGSALAGPIERSKQQQTIRLPLTPETRTITSVDRVRWRDADWEIVACQRIMAARQIELLISTL